MTDLQWYLLKGLTSVISSDSPCKCPIHNGTLETNI